MSDLLGLEGIAPTGAVRETPDLIEIPALLTFSAPPVCPFCAQVMTKNGVEDVMVADAPIRGKRVHILLQRGRRRCRTCKQSATASSAHIRSGYRVLTTRLVRYIENRVVKTTIRGVSNETGLSPDLVASLATTLDERLRASPSHWRTPAVVGVDNIQTDKRHRFQLLVDQLTSRPIAIAPTWEFEPIAKEIRRCLEIENVRVFTSDMAAVNLDIAELFTNAIHVADKFHVFHTLNRSFLKIISVRVAALEDQGTHGAAATLREAKRGLLGERNKEDGPTGQSMFDLDRLPNELECYPEIAAAHRARLALSRFYTSSGWIEGRGRLNDVYRRLRDPAIATLMRPALEYIENHDRQVLAYFEALDLIGCDLWSPTTNGLERRQGTLQEIWRSGRSYRTLPAFRLRAIYHPFTFGIHIIDCPRCGGFIGPVEPAQALAMSQSAQPLPLPCRRCPAKSTTPGSVESDASTDEYGVAA